MKRVSTMLCLIFAVAALLGASDSRWFPPPDTGPPVPTPDIAHWTFTETSGSTLTDVVGGHNGTLSGFSLPGAWLDPGLQFPGNATAFSLEVPNAAPIDVANVRSISVCFVWDTQLPNTDSGDYLLMIGDWNTNNSYSLGNYTTFFRCSIGRNFNGGFRHPNAGAFTNGQRYHALCTADASGHELYIDGASVGTIANEPIGVNSGLPLYIGTHSNTSIGRLEGKIYDLKLYTTRLGLPDAQQLSTECQGL